MVGFIVILAVFFVLWVDTWKFIDKPGKVRNATVKRVCPHRRCAE